MQDEDDDWPVSLLYFPKSQFLQDDFPFSFSYLPLTQKIHTCELTAPGAVVLELDVPVGQCLHSHCPISSEKSPIGQLLQVFEFALMANFPIVHAKHTSGEDGVFSGFCFHPRGQSEQEADPGGL